MERKTIYQVQLEYGDGHTLQERLLQWLLEAGQTQLQPAPDCREEGQDDS